MLGYGIGINGFPGIQSAGRIISQALKNPGTNKIKLSSS